ncbi:hypothetical protein K2173_019720 [Erythroxylum novogranatense]|uniref:EF-hand domain-containing protein n=1 Tax=Erythroxylum novogranatense TaxID=1862640 RepID=A0AAV8SM11_9ROSI|nr:hypothetical protein K2173_019720 [Erythroxylum novogranatense]
MDNASSTRISFNDLFLLSVIIIQSIIIIFREFYSCSCCPPHSFFNKLSCLLVDFTDKFSIHNAPIPYCNTLDGKLAQEMAEREIVDHGEELGIGEVEEVMGKLGTCYDPEGDKLQERISSNDVSYMLEEKEPSIEEVQEAFRVFDENDDGFISAEELRKVLIRLCYVQITEVECRRMIETHDENGDGLIDFDEFVRVMSISLS